MGDVGGRGWLDQLILEVFYNLNDSMILKWLQVTAFSLLCVKKAGKQTDSNSRVY